MLRSAAHSRPRSRGSCGGGGGRSPIKRQIIATKRWISDLLPLRGNPTRWICYSAMDLTVIILPLTQIWVIRLYRQKNSIANLLQRATAQGCQKVRHIKPQYYPSATYPAPAISSYQLQQSTHLYSAFLLALRVRCKWLVAKLFFAACYFFNPQKIKTMYHIKKSEDSWTIRNGDTGRSRKLTWLEMLAVMNEFPELGCQQVTSVYVEEIESVKNKPL